MSDDGRQGVGAMCGRGRYNFHSRLEEFSKFSYSGAFFCLRREGKEFPEGNTSFVLPTVV